MQPGTSRGLREVCPAGFGMGPERYAAAELEVMWRLGDRTAETQGW